MLKERRLRRTFQFDVDTVVEQLNRILQMVEHAPRHVLKRQLAAAEVVPVSHRSGHRQNISHSPSRSSRRF
jgi:hypothetical protein